MANLETLELTINGSAKQAKQGIDGLISRLSSLSKEIVKPYSDLRDFNAALKETARLSKSISFKNVGKSVGASVAKGVGATGGKFPSAKEIAESNAKMAKLRETAAMPVEAQSAQQSVSKRLIQERMAATAAKRAAFETKERANSEAKITEEIKGATKATEQQGSGVSKVKEGIGKLTKGISDFGSKVKRIATTMLIRAAIRGLIKDVKEGVNNFYEWSKLNNGTFAKSFDTIKAKGQELKNSVGAAIAPAISAAIPVIQALASAAINAFNWVNQLIALLTGKNYWTKATDNVDAYKDSVNAAGGAAKEWLASFDELNVMTSGGGGGGGGGASGITSEMFENTSRFSDSVREVSDFIKKNFEDIKLIAEGIGVAILSWKLANAFLETLPALSKIAGLIGIGATIAITLKANYMLTDQYLKTGNEGWLIASALTSAIGSVAAGAIAKKIFGGKVASAVISFGLVFSAITDVIADLKHTEVSALSKESLLTSIGAALKAGAGMGVILAGLGVSAMPVLAAAGGTAALTFLVSTGLKLITGVSNIKWGNFEATQEQIDAYVKQRMFTTDVTVMIEQMNAVLTNKQELEENIRKQLGKVNTEMNLLSLGIDKATTYKNLGETFDGEDGLIATIKNLCDVNVDLLKITFGTMQLYDGNGNALSSDILLSGMQGWANIKNEMEANGRELTDLLMKGARGELTPEMERYTQELLEKVTHMSERVTQAEEFGKATADFKTKALAAFSEGSFKGVKEAFE